MYNELSVYVPEINYDIDHMDFYCLSRHCLILIGIDALINNIIYSSLYVSRGTLYSEKNNYSPSMDMQSHTQ